MNNQKAVVIVAVTLVIAGTICYYIYQENNRYVMIDAGVPGVRYEIDKKTGRTWMIQAGSKVEQKDPEVEKTIAEVSERRLPSLESLKIDGNTGASPYVRAASQASYTTGPTGL